MTTITGAANDGAEYVVRTRPGGTITDAVCERGGQPPAPDGPCTASVVNGGIELEWDASFGDVNVRRNSRWITRVSGPSSTVVSGTAADSFEIIIRPGGVRTVIDCPF